MIKQAKIIVKGEVIGVGFRNWTKYHAKKLEVKGWVKNVTDQVEALLQAEQEQIEKLVKKLRRGPAISSVHEIEVFWEDPEEPLEGFKIVK